MMVVSTMVPSTIIPSCSFSPWDSRVGRVVLISSKRARPQVPPFQQMAEVQDGGLVGQRARELQPHEAAHRVRLVEQSLPPRRRGASMPGSLRL